MTERHATDLVTALNFDIRAFDTLGEEFILFASVLGVVLLLRELRDEDERPRQAGGRRAHLRRRERRAARDVAGAGTRRWSRSASTSSCTASSPPAAASRAAWCWPPAPLAVFLAGRYSRMRAVAPQTGVEIGDALGAAGYALVGLGGLVFAGVFFKNFLPLGIPGHLLSGGQIDVASVAVGLEVSGAFLVAWSEFLDQAILVRSDGVTHELPAVRDRRLAVRRRPVGGRLEQEPGPRDPVADRRPVVDVCGSARRSATARAAGADRRRHPPMTKAGRSGRPGAGADRRRDRGDGHGAAAGAGRPGAQAVRQRRSRKSCARCATDAAGSSGGADAHHRAARRGAVARGRRAGGAQALAAPAGQRSPRRRGGARGGRAVRILLAHAIHNPFAYWMGGWRPSHRWRSGSRSRSTRRRRAWPPSRRCS